LTADFKGRPHALLCEGMSDKRFYERLFSQRNIGADFTIMVPTVEGQYQGGGRSQFGRYLKSISVNQSFAENVKAVLIVSDNDEDPAASFKEVQDELREAKYFPIPNEELVAATMKEAPTVVVLMLPMGGVIGNLETLCLQSAYSKWPDIRPHLDTFVANTPPHAWALGKQDKMKIQSILAATNSKQPDAGFAGHWRQDQQFQIPLDHSCFDGLANFIANFGSVL
jgi:hypothetical protein